MIKTRMKSHNCGELNLNNLGEEVVLSGWASTIRDLRRNFVCGIERQKRIFPDCCKPAD